MDTKRLKQFFKETLHFDVKDAYESTEFSFTKENIVQFLEKVKVDIEAKPNKYYCIVVFIGSHGNERGIQTEEDKQISKMYKVEDIKKAFSNKTFPVMAGRPKIFLTQACRGNGREGTVLQPDNSPRSKTERSTANHNADSVVVYATTHGNVCWRDPFDGSTLIRECTSTFGEYWETDHLEEMLITVRSRISSWSCEGELGKEYRQTPEVSSTLTKRLKFANNIFH